MRSKEFSEAARQSKQRLGFLPGVCIRFIALPWHRKVSWIRRRDLHVLSTGTFTYTNDERFSVTHERGTAYWVLSVSRTQISDTGIYECQVPAQPKIFKRFWLEVIDIQEILA
ncbi:hypothetical protein HAZT_HAZT011863 [Hyalella azteca]|uniref:Ig-like domain-containing protein n=1 Tax=Hyalella azteca TaxID=294128 RepID=A0A6A0GS52_HYAAZ|nr:hypothetical protein HAZT_HAZT011863 [Hyalella azteca]